MHEANTTPASVPAEAMTAAAGHVASSMPPATATSGTVADWLAHVTPPPPPALRARLVELLEPHASRPMGEAAAACLEAGETQLARMLSSRATDRGSALDLLAVDALVTYAFEAASDTPSGLERLANEAMTRIAEIPEAS